MTAVDSRSERRGCGTGVNAQRPRAVLLRVHVQIRRVRDVGGTVGVVVDRAVQLCGGDGPAHRVRAVRLLAFGEGEAHREHGAARRSSHGGPGGFGDGNVLEGRLVGREVAIILVVRPFDVDPHRVERVRS